MSASSRTLSIHRKFQIAITFFLSIGSTSVTALSPAPAPSVPRSDILAPYGNVDLMDSVFHEGVVLYRAGNYEAAARLWQTPAERGHLMAQFSLGVAYATGQGVTRNLEQAVKWWQTAGTRGHLGAQLNLGLLYWRGEGIEKDLVKARMWWQRAANGGDATAQFHLGALAAVGEGEPRNYKEAVRWWKLSAAQGNRQAMKGLEILKDAMKESANDSAMLIPASTE